MKTKDNKKILVVCGTRPEAIKLVPIIATINQHISLSCKVCCTGQHSMMVEQVLNFFKMDVDYKLYVMKSGQDISYLTGTLISKLSKLFEKINPDCIIVQGDTTTAFIAALTAFYNKVIIAHIEAGLRTHNKYYPFPEEINRCLIAHLADLHFVPTILAKNNLLKEGIPPDKIFKVGNTSIDALHMCIDRMEKEYPVFKAIDFQKKIILVTAHRRESFGHPLEQMFKALIDIVHADAHVEIVYPVHLNPNVYEKAKKILVNQKRIHLLNPLPYDQLIFIMSKSYLILTDSGGIQEEAPSLKKPILVMRDETERPEGLSLGIMKLVGRDRKIIVNETIKLLNSESHYNKMVNKGQNPYGDGLAAKKITRIIDKYLTSFNKLESHNIN